MLRLKNNTFDQDVAWTIVFQSTVMLAKNMLVTVSNSFMALNGILNLLLFIAIGFFYVRLFLKYGFKMDKRVLFLLLIVVLFVLISYAFHNNLFEYSLVIQALYLFAVNAVPALIFFPRLESLDSLRDYFYKASYLLTVVVIVCVPIFLANKNVGNIDDYSMSYGQAAMVPCMFLYSQFFENRNWKALVLAIISNICIFAIGSRFPLLCVGVYVIIKVIQKLKNSKYKFLIILVPAVFIIVYLNQQSILLLLYKLLYGIGIRSRSLTFLINGNLTNTTGRGVIYEAIFKALKESPFVGYGFGGGYIVVDGMPHSIVLDIFCNVGIPLGVLIICWFVIRYLRELFLSKNAMLIELLLIFGCMFLPKAFLGGELWETDKFWWVIALLLFANTKRRYNVTSMEKNV